MSNFRDIPENTVISLLQMWNKLTTNADSDKVPLLGKFHSDKENSFKETLSKYKWEILGGFLSLSSGFLYAFYKLSIKEFNVNFVDTIFVRSSIQTFLASIFIVIKKKNFFPVFEDGKDKWFICKQYSILVLQVRLSENNE